MKSGHHRHSAVGFSLLEMLVAITILAIVAALLFSGFTLVTRSWHKQQLLTEEGERIRSVCDLIRRQVSCCYPAVPKEDPLQPKPEQTEGQPPSRFLNQKVPFFKGSGSKMTFVSLYSLHLNQLPGLCLITYALENSEKGRGENLVEYEMPYTCEDPEFGTLAATAEAEDSRLRQVLLEDVEDVSFSYFGVDQNEIGVKADNEIRQEWRNEWNSRIMGTLPDAVKIKYKMRSKVPSLQGASEFVMAIRSRGTQVTQIYRRIPGVPM